MLDTRNHFFFGGALLNCVGCQLYHNFSLWRLLRCLQRDAFQEILTFQRILSKGPREKVVRAVNLFERNYVRDRGNN
jgi:hypothetical protein